MASSSEPSTQPKDPAPPSSSTTSKTNTTSKPKGKEPSTPPTNFDDLFSVGSRWGPLALPTSSVVGLTLLEPPGDNSNYGNWELAMSGSIIGAGMGHVINPKLRDSDQPNFHWTQQNNAICSVLLRHAHPNNYTVMRPHMGNAASMWQALSDSHNDASMGSKMLVLRRLISCQMVDDDIDAHLTNVQQLATTLSQLVAKSKLSMDDIVCAAISASLPNDWNAAISSLMNQNDVTAGSLISALRREGIRRRDQASSSLILAVTNDRNQVASKSIQPSPKPIQAVQSSPSFSNASSSFRGKKRNPTSRSNNSASNDASCTHCNMKGHVWQSCHKLANQFLRQMVQNQPQLTSPPRMPEANVIQQSRASSDQIPLSAWNPAPDTQFHQPEGSGFLITTDACALSTGTGKRLWILDSGCTQTCVPSFTYEEILNSTSSSSSKFSSIKVANGIGLNVTQQRVMPIPWNGNDLRLEVIEVPGLKHSLLSISQLRSLGFSTSFLTDRVEILSQDGSIVCSGYYQNGLAILQNDEK